MEHRFAEVNDIRLHYVIAGSGRPLLLMHGFPQTWYEWRAIIPRLAEHYTVIAPDYRGAGDSGRTHAGYEKFNVADDLRQLVRQLGFEKVGLVGHDMGAMVVYAYAAQYESEVCGLVLMDAPVPGTKALQAVRASPRAWHTNFHAVRDLAEFLVAGREQEYISHFFKSRFTLPGAVPDEDIERYVKAYSTPGAIRAAFEMYRAWEQDAIDNAPHLARKLDIPVMVMGAEMSVSGPTLREMTGDIAKNGVYREVAKSGHWLCEQNPDQVGDFLFDFYSNMADWT